jgi:MFS family permease
LELPKEPKPAPVVTSDRGGAAAGGIGRTFRQSIALLGTRRFGTYWFATLLSNLGSWAQMVAEPWLLLSLGASSFLIGLDAFALDAPVLLLTLVGGALADRADRRRVITLFQSIQMVCPIVLAILLLAGAVQPWIVIALSFIVGITDALSMPSFQSIVPSIVEREQIGAGLALNSTQFNLSRILGPAIAGVLMTSIGIVGCFVVNAVSYLPFILIALWVLPPRLLADGKAGSLDLRHPFAGIRRVVRDRRLGGALLTVLTTSTLCAPLITFSPVLVKNIFHGSAGFFSVAIAAFGIGGLLGASLLLTVDDRRDRRRLSSRAATCYGFVAILVSLNPWLWGLPPLLVLAGIAMSISNTSANTFLLTSADPALRGRTVSLFMFAMRGGAALGNLVAGVSVHLLGVREALFIYGVVAITAHLVIARSWLRT